MLLQHWRYNPISSLRMSNHSNDLTTLSINEGTDSHSKHSSRNHHRNTLRALRDTVGCSVDYHRCLQVLAICRSQRLWSYIYIPLGAIPSSLARKYAFQQENRNLDPTLAHQPHFVRHSDRLGESVLGSFAAGPPHEDITAEKPAT